MQLPTDSFVNIHSHRKPQLPEEFVIRNAYLQVNLQNLNQLPYAVSVGLHPWHLQQMTVTECADKLVELATHTKVLAIGEIGLDKAIETSLAHQLSYFEAQLNVARALQKPVILHAVKSYNELIPYIKKSMIPFVFHQFQGNEQQAKELLKHSNVYLSFSKNIWHEKAEQVAKNIPISRLFLETDTSSTLTIKEVYIQMAKIREIPLIELQDSLNQNFNTVFANSH